jgi:ADP-ribose diphosphatase
MSAEKIIYQAKYFTLAMDAEGVEMVKSGDEVLVVPMINREEVLLVREPSAALGGTVLVLPGGEIEANEAHADTANRELQEEVGYRAQKLTFLGELHPFSKYLTVRSFVFLACDLIVDPREGDEDHEIGVERIPLELVESLVTSGRLHDARVIAALLLARSLLKV